MLSVLHLIFYFVFERLPSLHLPALVTCLESTMAASICEIDMRNKYENQCVKCHFKVNNKI